MVAAVNGELIGMLATSPCTAEGLDSWAAGFSLARGTVEQHVQLDAGIISPVFSAQAGSLLAGEKGGCLQRRASLLRLIRAVCC